MKQGMLSFVIVITLTFLFFTAINQIKLPYYETIHRLSTLKTLSFTLISEELDRNLTGLLLFLSILLSIITFTLKLNKEQVKKFWIPTAFGLASLLFFASNHLILSLLSFSIFALTYHKLKNQLWNLLNNCLLFLIIVEALSAIRWTTYPIFYSPMYSDITWTFSKLDSFLFYSFNTTLGSFAILLFIFSFPLSILPFIRVKIQGKKLLITIHKTRENNDLKISINEKLALASSFLILLYLSYYAYLPSLNPEGKPVSVDLVFYKEYLEKFKALGFNQNGFTYLLQDTGGGRATIVLLTYIVNIFLQDTAEAIKFSYFLASYLLVLSTYISLKTTTKNKKLATTSVYFSTFSIQTVVGLYAGYLANWIAISLLLLSLTCFSMAFKEKKYIIPSILFSALALFSHPWSWTITILAVLLLLPLNHLLAKLKLRKTYNKQEALLILGFFLANLVLDTAKQNLLNSLGGAHADYTITVTTFSPTNIFTIERNLHYLTQILVGGYTTNILIFLASTIGATQLLKYEDPFFDTLYLILPIAATPFIFVDATTQSRLIYFLPTNIYTTLGTHKILTKLEEKTQNKAFLLAILHQLNYTLRSTANLV